MSATVDYPARVRFVVTDTSGNDQHGLLWGVRSRNYSGSATAALSYEAEQMTALNSAGTAALSGASGGSVVQGTSFPAATWIPMLYTNLTAGAAPLTHVGAYRAWARCFSSAATPRFQLQWGVGALSVPTTNDPVRLPGTASFYMLDLGPVNIQAPPTGPTQWFGVVQAKVDTANDHVAIDRVFFVPLDESAGQLTYIATTPASSVTATNNAGTAVDDSGTGSVAWSNPTNVKARDGSYASATAGFSHFLKATGFGLSIPTGATIKGIAATVTRELFDVGSNIARDNAVRLVKAGVVQATDRSNGASWVEGVWTDVTYGGATDLWGGAWTPSDINNAGFGLAFAVVSTGSAASRVDLISMTVYYVLAGGLTVAQDAVIYASRTAELRTDGMIRSDAGGTIYAPVSQVTGDLPRLPPSGLENRATQIFVKASRGDLDQLPDSGLDGFTVTTKYRPSFLFRP